MARDEVIGFSDAQNARFAEVVRAVETADAALVAAQARMTRALADARELAREVAASSPAQVRARDMAERAISSEIGAALRLSDRAVQRRMDAAAELASDYPRTLAALEAGPINAGHVRVITDAGSILPTETRAVFETHALARCEAQTPGRAKRAIEMLAQRLHPRSFTERHLEARERRGVSITPLGEGMSHLGIDAPTVLVDAAYDRATRMARALLDLRAQAAARVRDARASGREPDPADLTLTSDTRTTDQLRADLMADLLLTGNPGADAALPGDGAGTLGAIRAQIQVVVPALSLIGAAHDAADLAGRSPIDADTARRLSGGNTEWRRILTDPIDGRVLASDRRLAPPDLRRWVQARDQHCRFPGCTTPAIRCEIDHVVDWAKGGPTAADNLQALCQRHHSMKQFTAWRVSLLDHGVISWTSPLGHTYTDHASPPVVFFSEDPLPGGVSLGVADHRHPTGDAAFSSEPDDPPPWEDSAHRPPRPATPPPRPAPQPPCDPPT